MDILVTRASGVLGKCSRSSNMPQFLLSWALAGTKGEGRSERRREDCREKRARPRGRGTGDGEQGRAEPTGSPRLGLGDGSGEAETGLGRQAAAGGLAGEDGGPSCRTMACSAVSSARLQEPPATAVTAPDCP